jgi:hypothetical protein
LSGVIPASCGVAYNSNVMTKCALAACKVAHMPEQAANRGAKNVNNFHLDN